MTGCDMISMIATVVIVALVVTVGALIPMKILELIIGKPRMLGFDAFVKKLVDCWHTAYSESSAEKYESSEKYFEIALASLDRNFELLSYQQRCAIKKAIKEKYPEEFKRASIHFARYEGFSYFPSHILETRIKK